MAQSYTLYELNEYIKRVIALNFAEPIWINCEISQMKNSRGNIYLDLVQQDENDEVVAQSGAAIWYKTYLFLKSKLGELLPSLLNPGVHVMIKVKVEYNERYGMKLIVEDIDPSYTIGKQEMARQKILERLKLEEVTELNKLKYLPIVIQKIAVISAENAAGYIDFCSHLENNNYGYKYLIDLFPAAMQGSNTEAEVCGAIDAILNSKKAYDIITIIRGGGSKLDLAAFDNFNIGYKIATAPIPVFTGIGHEIDQSIADLMAHTAMKTPTAVADYIIDHSLTFESQVSEAMMIIEREIHQQLKNHHLQLQNMHVMLGTLPLQTIRNQRQYLNQYQATITQTAYYKIQNQKSTLMAYKQIVHVADPVHTLQKGYAIIIQKGKFIVNKTQLETGEMTIKFSDGDVQANTK